MALTSFSNEQRLANLEKAHASRSRRKEIADLISSGKVSPAIVITSDEPVVLRWRVRLFLKCIPRIGERKALRIMKEVGIPENRRIQGIGPKQLEALLLVFERMGL